MVVSEDNEVFAFGAGTLGECGYGEFNNVALPKRVYLNQKSKHNEPIR